MAEGDDPGETFAARLKRVLEELDVSQKELARRLAGPGAPLDRVENKRTGVIRWLGGKHEPERESVRAVEVALGLAEGYLMAVVRRKPRGRPRGPNELDELRGRVEELERRLGQDAPAGTLMDQLEVVVTQLDEVPAEHLETLQAGLRELSERTARVADLLADRVRRRASSE